jgi:hypothetical protein
MLAAENRADDVRRQNRETKEPRRIGRNKALRFGNINSDLAKTSSSRRALNKISSAAQSLYAAVRLYPTEW